MTPKQLGGILTAGFLYGLVVGTILVHPVAGLLSGLGVIITALLDLIPITEEWDREP